MTNSKIPEIVRVFKGQRWNEELNLAGELCRLWGLHAGGVYLWHWGCLACWLLFGCGLHKAALSLFLWWKELHSQTERAERQPLARISPLASIPRQAAGLKTSLYGENKSGFVATATWRPGRARAFQNFLSTQEHSVLQNTTRAKHTHTKLSVFTKAQCKLTMENHAL